jgi:tetratricopeptide (TPR) repeat protein
MAKAGRFEEALKVAERIVDAEKRSEALREIAEAMTEAGRFEEGFEEVLKVAEWIDGAWERSWALREIAEAMAKAGRFEEALKLAERIEGAGRRSKALIETAEAMSKAGMMEEARKVFEEALKLAERIEGAWRRSGALREIAETMAKAGMIEGAREVFWKAWEVAQKAVDLDRLWEVAQSAARSGLFDLAVEFSKNIAGKRTEKLPKVLYALVARKGEGGAKEAVLSLLPLCGWAMETAIHGCCCLIHLYPDHAQSIAEKVRQMV